ncbi:MAG TPA: prepilin-type N-terminal cleavage/methylation domain-containing protein [Gemmataceae bacterium]|jgi:general secretion pathway protein G|nr:prepilin-type N-terminal cleavage/methylation domain-containing protein [Gemmataceae bacterium]
MVLQPRLRSVNRRSAFTLLEILVVVAIILVLASVATVAVMNYLEDAKIDKTRLNLKAAEKAAQTAIIKNGGNEIEGDLTQAASRYIEGGADNMKDGWNQPITVSMQTDKTGTLRPQAVANTPKGVMTSWD